VPVNDTRQPQAARVREALNEIGPASWSELVNHLGVGRGKGGNRLRRLLNRMLKGGEIVREGRNRYCLSNTKYETGIVERSGSQLGVSLESGGSMVLESARGVRDGDTVHVFVDGGIAQFVELIKPSTTPIVGIFQPGRIDAHLESLVPGYSERVELIGSFPGCREGDVVEVQILGAERGRPQGKVTAVIQHKNEVERACTTIIRAHGVPHEWPSVVAEENVQKSVLKVDRKDRVDLRNTAFVTIDGEDARDFDDALYAEQRPRGGWRLLVAIADVAHYVRPGSALDREAAARGNSVYFPDRVIPMLPESLSNNLCSLRPNEDRLAMICELTLTRSANVTDFSFYEAVIRSQGRLTYTQVDQYLKSGETNFPDTICASLRHLYSIYQGLRVRRSERGALDFESREGRIEIRHGNPIGVVPIERTDAHLIVEEAMIAANVAAANYLQSQESTVMYRVHEPPQQEKIEQLRNIFRSAGQRFPGGVRSPRDLQRLVAATHKTRIEPWIWELLILRTLQQARYFPGDKGHFGLALSSYAHFTSPIRRYADLINHRLIKARLRKERRSSLGYEELEDIGAHLSMTERRAENATRAVDAWLKCALLEERVGEAFGGTIVTVTEFGVFVELDDIHVQGLLHVSRLGSDYYKWIPNLMSLVGERSGHRFSLGGKLRVVVEDVSVEMGRVDLRTEAPERKKRVRRRRRKKAL